MKYVEPVQKHVNKCEQRIIPENDPIILLKLHHECHTAISVWARRNLRRGRWFKMAEILMPPPQKKNIICISLERVHVTSEKYFLRVDCPFKYSNSNLTRILLPSDTVVYFAVFIIISSLFIMLSDYACVCAGHIFNWIILITSSLVVSLFYAVLIVSPFCVLGWVLSIY